MIIKESVPFKIVSEFDPNVFSNIGCINKEDYCILNFISELLKLYAYAQTNMHASYSSEI